MPQGSGMSSYIVECLRYGRSIVRVRVQASSAEEAQDEFDDANCELVSEDPWDVESVEVTDIYPET